MSEETKLHRQIESYKIHISGVKRFSPRTCAIYSDVLKRFEQYTGDVDPVTQTQIRNYEVHILDEEHLKPKTANLHLSVLSSFFTFLVRSGEIKSNPVKVVRRPKVPKRLPEFYKEDEMVKYFSQTQIYASEEFLQSFKAAFAMWRSGNKETEAQARELYEKRLERAVVSSLANLGIRRAELVGMNVGDLDFSRKVVSVRGKGDKMREIPVISSLCEEILLYLDAVETMVGEKRKAEDAMFVTWSGRRIYPVCESSTVSARSLTSRNPFSPRCATSTAIFFLFKKRINSLPHGVSPPSSGHLQPHARTFSPFHVSPTYTGESEASFSSSRSA